MLVVDDNAGTAVLIGGALADAGARVESTRSPESGVNLAVKLTPHAIVIHLPTPLDGAALLAVRLKSHPVLAATPIIALIGRDQIDPETAAVVTEVLPRPFSPELVVARVGALHQQARSDATARQDMPPNGDSGAGGEAREGH